jgi:hypothetical protein
MEPGCTTEAGRVVACRSMSHIETLDVVCCFCKEQLW